MGTTVSMCTNATENSTQLYSPPFNETEVIISAVIIVAFIVFGVIGNTITIAVILKYNSLRNNPSMRFIISLCFSDLISALISWIFLYRRTWGFDDWSPLPGFLCKFYWAADMTTSYATALHVLFFALIRLLSIKFPFSFKKLTKRIVNVWITLIWVICFCAAFIPYWLMYGPSKPNRNSDTINSRWPACTLLIDKLAPYQVYHRFAFPIFIFLPTIGVILTCGLIMVFLKIKSKVIAKSISDKNRQQRDRQILIQLILIICSFLLGYLPFTAYEFWAFYDHPRCRYYFLVDSWFGMIEYFFLRLSECLNPVFYNLGSKKMRNYTKQFVAENIFSCCVKQTNNNGTFFRKKALHFSAGNASAVRNAS